MKKPIPLPTPDPSGIDCDTARRDMINAEKNIAFFAAQARAAWTPAEIERADQGLELARSALAGAQEAYLAGGCNRVPGPKFQPFTALIVVDGVFRYLAAPSPSHHTLITLIDALETGYPPFVVTRANRQPDDGATGRVSV